jgi:C4-dicarboxylate-specific signal transduction histidine kinase
MARGDLQHPVVTGSEADEVGRLAFVLDEMRRSLETQIRTIEELNVGLEAKVTLRTADLERANHDLQAALDSLTRAQDQLVRSEKLASIGQLVAGIAHELNNPVNAISNSLTPLQQALAPVLEGAASADLVALREDLPAMLRVIRNGAQRIQRIVSALSSYSRTRSDQAERVDLPQLLDETLDLAWHLLVGVKVERQYAPEARVEGHRGELGQVLMNLVANAAQAVAGRPDPWIGATVEVAGDEVRVTVADSGPGVPAEVRARIFDPFFTTKPVGQGTGLGLSISHEIVTEHRGRIELAERPGGGAVFTVVLPRMGSVGGGNGPG